MAEPRLRFKDDNGNAYPAWQEYELDEILTERNEPHLITEDAPQLSFTIEQGVIYPEDKKTNKRDFLMKDKDNKKFLLTEYNDIIYNPANLKFGAIHRNVLGRGVVSPIYAIFYTDQNPAFIEGVVTNPKFIKSSLKYLEGTVVKLMTLKPRDFVKMKVWIPLLEEQKKIADFLSSVDEVIAASEKEVANLETQKKAVMKKIFSQEVRFKRKDGTDFPEWEEDYVGNRCKIQTGKSNTQDAIEDGEYPFYVRSPLIYRSKRYLFDTEAVITVGDGVGTGKVYHYVNGKFDLHQRAYALTDFIGVTGKYFYCYFSANFYERVRAMTAKTSVDSVRYDMIDKMKIKIPCIEEQYLIANFLSDFDEAIAAAKKELELWKQLKKGLLQQMFV